MKKSFLFALAIYFPSQIYAQYVKSASAKDFVNSIGVTTHWNYTDTPYSTQFDTVFSRLVEIGIPHVRDGGRLAELSNAGITSTAYADVPNFSSGDEGTITEIVSSIKSKIQAGYKIDVVEGPNEPDLFWVSLRKSYKGMGYLPNQTDQERQQSISQGVLAFMSDFHKAIKADPVTSKLKVIGPSLGYTYDPGGGKPNPFPDGSLTNLVDYGNIHPYPGGNPFSLPDHYAGIEKYFWSGTQPSGNIDEWPYAFNIYWPPFKPKPMAATETGYSTFTGSTPESVHAKYIPRLFFEYFRAGIVRTYLYEFLDEFNKPEDRESNFGLIRHNLSRKPAFNALKSVIQLLKDSGTNVNADSIKLNFVINAPAGYDRTQYVRRLLFKKSDGTFYLVMYHEIASSDGSHNPQRDLVHPDIPVTIDIDLSIQVINQYRYDNSYNFVKEKLNKFDNSKVSLNIQDKVTILELIPVKPLEVYNNSLKNTQSVKLVPNPAREKVEISSTLPGIIYITDLTGKLLLQESTTGLVEVKTTGLEAGMYIVTLKTTEGMIVNKLKID